MYNSNVLFTYQAGFNMLTVLAAEEFKADEILCMALHPGWVKTELGGDEVNVDFFFSQQCFRMLTRNFRCVPDIITWSK